MMLARSVTATRAMGGIVMKSEMGCELLALPQRQGQPFLGAVRSAAAGRAPTPRASTLVPFPEYSRPEGSDNVRTVNHRQC
jgi:hypothetical protein